MANKKNWWRMLAVVLAFGMALFGCDETESSMDGDHYGKLTIKNESSYAITQIKITKYSDESGDKIIDTNQLASQSSRTYEKDDVMKLEYSLYSWGGDFKHRYVTVSFNNNNTTTTTKTRNILLSEGHDVELVLTNDKLKVSNPLYVYDKED